MKITEISVQVVEPGLHTVIAERLILDLANVVVRVRTDEGLEGVAGSTTYLGARSVAAAVAELKPLLIGEDPLYRERIWQRLNEVSIIVLPPHAIALLDCALWDLAGKAVGLPVYKLLGAQRDRIRAYASTLTYNTLADFQREVEAEPEARLQGGQVARLGRPPEGHGAMRCHQEPGGARHRSHGRRRWLIQPHGRNPGRASARGARL